MGEADHQMTEGFVVVLRTASVDELVAAAGALRRLATDLDQFAMTASTAIVIAAAATEIDAELRRRAGGCASSG